MTATQTLTAAQRDRARGVMVAMATADALGAPLEFKAPFEGALSMTGGGAFGWEPAEWTDDTSMAVVIARALVAHGGSFSQDALDDMVTGWIAWAAESKDVGSQTSAVLGHTRRQMATRGHWRSAAHTSGDYAADGFARNPRGSGGNGSLMRTAPVALASLHVSDGELVRRARAVSALTHGDPEAADACAIWCLLIRHAVLTGELLPHRDAIALAVPEIRRGDWAVRMDVATGVLPTAFANNGWVVAALQAAYSAQFGDHDDAPAGSTLTVIEAAVRCGGDTDTVGAIAGALAGALRGADDLPDEWLEMLHGWPTIDADALRALVDALIDPTGA